MASFSDRLTRGIKEKSPIIVGIDPNFRLMPKFLWPSSGEAEEIKRALVQFSQLVVDAVSDHVPAVKFQSAYFEQFGSKGMEALAQCIKYAKSKGLIVILDAKRGDIYTTSEAYAQAYLSGGVDLGFGGIIQSDFEVDCMTINPFLGIDSVQPFIEVVNSHKKGVFVVVKSSNPGSGLIQDVDMGGQSVAEKLATLVNEWGQLSIGESNYSCVGAVVGATYPREAENLRKLMPNSILLVPGSGAQGGSMASSLACFNSDGLGAVVAISRSVTYPRVPGECLSSYSQSVRTVVCDYVDQIRYELRSMR